MNFSLETARLHIRSYTPDDLDAAAAILGDPVTMRFWPRPLTREEAEAWVNRAVEVSAAGIYGRRALVLRATGAIIGDTGVVRALLAGEERADLGYIVDHRYWRQGFAYEAARALMDHYFDAHGLDALYANMAWDHIGSQRVAEKLGMRKIQEYDNPRNRGIRTFLYRIERAEWMAK